MAKMQQAANPMMGMFGNQQNSFPPMMGSMQQTQSPPMMGNMQQQQSAGYEPDPSDPGYFTNPEFPGQRYEQPSPGYFRPSDLMPQAPPNKFALPNPFYNKPGGYPPFLDQIDPQFDFSKPNFYEKPLPYPFTDGIAGTLVEENPLTAINIANTLGIDASGGDPKIKGIMGWLDTEQGQMFMDTYQDAIDDK